MSRAQLLARSLRPHMVILQWLIYSIVVIASRGLDILMLVAGLVLFIAVYGVVAIQNDISDRRVDRFNRRKDIPLANNQLKESDLYRLLLSLVLVSILIGSLIHQTVLLWVATYIFFGWVYSGPISAKSRGYFALLILGICYGVMPWLLGFIVTGKPLSLSEVWVIFASFIYSFGIISLKDFKDQAGDKRFGKNTLLVLKGSEFTQKFILSLTSLAYAMTICLCVWQNTVILAFVGILLLCVNFLLLRRKEIISIPRVRGLMGSNSRMLFFFYLLVVYIA